MACRICCIAVLLLGPLASCAQSEKQPQQAALVRCENAFRDIAQVPPDQKALTVVAACKDVFPAGACRDAFEKVERIAPDARSRLIKESCGALLAGEKGKSAGLMARRRLLLQQLINATRLIQVIPPEE